MTSSPQGDGNSCSACPVNCSLIFHDLFPARGRKLCPNKLIVCSVCKFHDLFPARGRKPLTQVDLKGIQHEFHDLFPARGRKHAE